mmetsp:Transcript_10837/g.22927  ORF Transcript_10837/g.22927 Transcript_10837/m.22927 type:complete len:275 (-) Transcript_10837:362-1186(-)
MKAIQSIPLVAIAMLPFAVTSVAVSRRDRHANSPKTVSSISQPQYNRKLYDVETIDVVEMEIESPPIMESELIESSMSMYTDEPTTYPTSVPAPVTASPTSSPTTVASIGTFVPTTAADKTDSPTPSPIVSAPGDDDDSVPTIHPIEYVKPPTDDDDADYIGPPHVPSPSSGKSGKSSKSANFAPSSKSSKSSNNLNGSKSSKSDSKAAKSTRSGPLEESESGYYSSSSLNRVSSLNSFADISSAPVTRTFGYDIASGVIALSAVAIHVFMWNH